MPFSARNRISGVVHTVETDAPIAEVAIDAGDAGELTAVVTSDAAESLDLSPGDEVEAVVEATSVMMDAGQ